MIEILFLIWYTRKIGDIARSKGLKATGYQVITVISWFGCEIIGAAIGNSGGASRLGVYSVALMGASLGALIAYTVARLVSPSPSWQQQQAPAAAPSQPRSGSPLALRVGPGEVIATVGVLLGFIAIWLRTFSVGFSYRNLTPSVLAWLRFRSRGFPIGSSYGHDGTLLFFLLVALALAIALLLAGANGRRGLYLGSATAGAAALGFFLFIPAWRGFSHLGDLRAGAWLGLCSVLIPIGAMYSYLKGRQPAVPDKRGKGPVFSNAALASLLATALGLVLVLSGIWTGTASYWDLSHTLGILMILLVVLTAALVVTTYLRVIPGAGDAALLSAAVTYGLGNFLLIYEAFGHFEFMSSGRWLVADGGVISLLGVVMLRNAVAQGVTAPAPAAEAAGQA